MSRRSGERSFLVLLLNLEEIIQSLTIKYRVICGFFVDGLHQVEEIPFCSFLLSVIITGGCWILSVAFTVYLDGHMVLFFMLLKLCITQPCIPWIKPPFVVVYTSFYILLDSFVEDLCIHFHKICWSVVSFSYAIFAWFLYQTNTGHIEWVWKCFILFYFLEEFVKICCNPSLNIW